MKIKLGKLLNIVSQLAVAIPTIAEAVKPIIHEVKGSKAPPAIRPTAPVGEDAASASSPRR